METEVVELRYRVKWSVPKEPQIVFQNETVRISVTFKLVENGLGAWVTDPQFTFEETDGQDAMGATRWKAADIGLTCRGLAAILAQKVMELEDKVLMPHVVDDKVVSQA